MLHIGCAPYEGVNDGEISSGPPPSAVSEEGRGRHVAEEANMSRHDDLLFSCCEAEAPFPQGQELRVKDEMLKRAEIMKPFGICVIAEGLYLEKGIEDSLIPDLLLCEDICGKIEDIVLAIAEPFDAAVEGGGGGWREGLAAIGILKTSISCCAEHVEKTANVKGPDHFA